jgi:hypothetical protein
MAESIASGLLTALGLYAAFGLVFAIAFAGRGVDAIDPGAHGATRGFRMLIVPGAAALWPLLLRRWLRGSSAPPIEHNPHREAAR